MGMFDRRGTDDGVAVAFGRIWQGYARRALDHLDELLLSAI